MKFLCYFLGHKEYLFKTIHCDYRRCHRKIDIYRCSRCHKEEGIISGVHHHPSGKRSSR